MSSLGRWTLITLAVAVLLLTRAPSVHALLYGPVANTTEFFNALDNANGSDEADTILFADGTFDFSNTTITHNDPTKGDLALVGMGETRTILDGGGANQIININIPAGPGNITLITIKDLTLQNGKSVSEGGAAAVRTSSSGLLIDHVRFLENESDSRGGGLYFTTSSGDLDVMSSWFFSNRTIGVANADGGGMYASHLTTGSAEVEDSNFEKNLLVNSGSGGGAYVVASTGTITVERNMFTDNDATNGVGGGLYVRAGGTGGAAEVENCLFGGNVANLGGGLDIAASSGSLSVVNITAVSNSTVQGAGGMYASLDTNTATLEIYNSIFNSNTIGSGGGQDFYVANNDNGTVTIRYNSYEDRQVTGSGATESNNIDVDPLLDSGYMLSAGSSCIDAGSSSLAGGSVDLAGNDRIVDDPDTVDTGSGSPAVDLGAYEFQPAASGGGGGGGGGGGCNTAGPVTGEPIWLEIMWLVILGGALLLRRRKTQA